MKNDSAPDASNDLFWEFLHSTHGRDDTNINNALVRLRPELDRIVTCYPHRRCDFSALEQAAFLAALKAADQFNSSRSNCFPAFAKMVIGCGIRDELDRIRRLRLMLLSDLEFTEEPPKPMEDAMCDSPAIAIEKEEARQEVQAAVREWLIKRSPRQKEYIQLRFTEGCSKAESARWMHVSKAAITKLNRALISAGKTNLASFEECLVYL